MKNIKKFAQTIFEKFKKSDKILLLILFLIFIYILYFCAFTFTKQDTFLAGRYDLGNMDQTVWNTVHGRIFTFVNPDLNQEMSRLSVHADFILILLAPLYLIWENAKMLLLIQSVVVGFGALFVYLFGKHVLNQRLIPAALAVSYLLNPFVERQNIFEFHPIALATTFLIACFYFLERKRYALFFVFLILAGLTKEHVWGVIGFIGLYIFIIKKKKWGIVLSIFSFLFFYLLISKFIPDARMENHFALAFYDDFGDSPKEIIKTFFVNPKLTIEIIKDNNLLEYYKNLLRPVGYLSLLSPLYLIFALPELLINSLSKNPNWRMYIYHYSAISISFIYISSFFAVRSILKRFPLSSLNIFIYILFFAFLSAYTFGPLQFSKKADPSMKRAPINKVLIKNYLETIPPDAFVASSNNLGAHLSHRRKSYSFETNDYLKAEYILFLFAPNALENPKSKDWDVKRARALLENSEYRVDYKLNNFIVFKRLNSLEE
jgi:uncharacterized membrane protein